MTDWKMYIEVAIGVITLGSFLLAIYKSGQADAVRKSSLVTRDQMEKCQVAHEVDRSATQQQLGELHEKVNVVAKDTMEIKGYLKGMMQVRQPVGG